MPRVFKWPSGKPLPVKFLAELKGIAEGGNVFVYPTSTLYGLGAVISSDAGVRAVNGIKSRPAGMPLSVMAGANHIGELCSIPEIAVPFLMSGDTRITAILPALDSAPPSVVHRGTLAIRLPCSELTASLVGSLGPVTSTSANPHGMPTPVRIGGVMERLGESVSVYIDSGTLDGKPTTLIDYTGREPKIIREGAISREEAERVNER